MTVAERLKITDVVDSEGANFDVGELLHDADVFESASTNIHATDVEGVVHAATLEDEVDGETLLVGGNTGSTKCTLLLLLSDSSSHCWVWYLLSLKKKGEEEKR